VAKTGDRDDPCVGFRFQVRFNDFASGGFSDCNGLSLETEVQDLSEGGVNDHVHRLLGRTKQINLVLKRGITDISLWDWYSDLTQGTVTYRDGTISVFDPSGDHVVISFEVRDAIPVKWQGPELAASQNAVAVETVELAHAGLRRRK
jgi:phage tail-like protein